MADHPDFVDMAHYYIKTMERMIDLEKNPKGEYVYDELLRLEELVSGESSQLSNEKRMELQVSPNLRVVGLLLYTISISFHVECCIIKLWCFSVIVYDVTSTAHNHHTDIYPLLNL